MYKQSLYKNNSFKNNYLFYVLMCQCKMNITNAIQRRESGFGKCEQTCMRFLRKISKCIHFAKKQRLFVMRLAD